MNRFFLGAVATLLIFAAGQASAIQRGDPQRGEDLAEACMACHSADAVRNNPEWPRLHGQYLEYLVHALRAYKSGDRENALMQQQVQGLSLQDKRDLAAWFSQQDGELYVPRRR
ncbi:MAG: cytochrome c [Ectothiorhodospiraceae bacterium]|nr:cytochrome c [Ectothiorhodospiraceae bacterium]